MTKSYEEAIGAGMVPHYKVRRMCFPNYQLSPVRSIKFFYKSAKTNGLGHLVNGWKDS